MNEEIIERATFEVSCLVDSIDQTTQNLKMMNVLYTSEAGRTSYEDLVDAFWQPNFDLFSEMVLSMASVPFNLGVQSPTHPLEAMIERIAFLLREHREEIEADLERIESRLKDIRKGRFDA